MVLVSLLVSALIGNNPFVIQTGPIFRGSYRLVQYFRALQALISSASYFLPKNPAASDFSSGPPPLLSGIAGDIQRQGNFHYKTYSHDYATQLLVNSKDTSEHTPMAIGACAELPATRSDNTPITILRHPQDSCRNSVNLRNADLPLIP